MSAARRRPLSFSAFVMNTASHITHGLWRDPAGGQIDFNSLDLWVDLAKQLEAGGFDVIFFADVVGVYGGYRGGWAHHAELGLQIPSNDPLVILSALASHTEHLGLAFTAGPIQEPPFNFARRVATLDHASNGRIAWNIVTSVLENAWRNFGHDSRLAHDSRYQLAEEYVDVLYKLWEGSWEDDALRADRASGIYADPSKIHKINHVSDNYRVEGPFLVSPSPQRTPLLFQAGSSPAGRNFAARNAEAQFIVSPDPDNARKLIDDTRGLVAGHGRNPDDLRFFQGLSFVIGSSEAEARAKEAELEEKIDVDGMIAHFGGSLGVDLGEYEPDTPIDVIHTEGGQSGLAWLRESAGGRTPTLEDVVRLRAKNTRVVGTPEQIADALWRWRDAGVDGINVVNSTIPGSYTEFIEYVLPVLRERGLARKRYEPGTLRAKLFGSDRLSARHPAARYRGAFRPAAALS
ncbi:MAG: NtaA/DmoA family FMN-dependent monooxygenase [Solirubrobacterales bacterium]|nr:NtaA/DmoA family FMN-dependent monooxygenase [Solirubrobacterales bacterium]